ncbi:MAG: hypothetical protein MJZ52_03635 [Bacteroidales bacterium]|nr:hypothetical protein [Bacteroidales bacterium]
MITTQKTEENKGQKKDRLWRQVLSGNFLFSPRTKKWYPFCLYIFILMLLVVINEHAIANKRQKVKELETEYKLTIGQLKHNNRYILYDENQKLINLLNEKGFEKNDKHIYKIVVEKLDEDAE